MRPWRIVELAAVGLLVAVFAWSLAAPDPTGLAGAGREREEAVPEWAEEEAPPDEWLLSQRLFGSSISATTLQAAAEQADRLGAAAVAGEPVAARARWRFVGPTNIGGRIVDLALEPDDPDTVYAAAATGGVWKSTDAGDVFAPAWPGDRGQSMGALAMASDGTLYAGAGEANPGGGSLTYGGGGVFRSRDGAATWRPLGPRETFRIGRIAVDPTNPDRLFVAAAGPLFRPGGTRGLLRSVDAGESWEMVLTGPNDTTGAVDVAIDPENPNRVYAVLWDHLRQPDLRTYGGVGSGVYRSDDGGDTWELLDNGLPANSPDVGRIGLALAPSNPDILYAIVIDTPGFFFGFFTSTDGGDSWLAMPQDPLLDFSQSSFGWWFGRVWVDPLDPAHVFAAGVPLAESFNGGANWAIQLGAIHADQHAMVWHPDRPGRVYLGNDGGVYRSETNGTGGWIKATYEPYTQFYSLDVSELNPSRVVGGSQDNGSLRSYPDDWNSHGGGDGEENLINPQDQDIIYFCSQYGNCRRSDDGGETSRNISSDTTSSRRNWFTPLQFDPRDPSIMYYGGNILNRSTDGGDNWTAISPDLTGGPGRDQLYPFGTMTTVAAARTDGNVVYLGTDDGRLWRTPNLGADWVRLRDDDIPGTWVTRVIVHPGNEDIAWATFSGYRAGSPLPYVARTLDGGETWTDITGDLPRAPVNAITLARGRLYVGTDVGVFYTANGGVRWLRLGRLLPRAPVTDIRYHPATNVLYAATFGRGIYRVRLPDL